MEWAADADEWVKVNYQGKQGYVKKEYLKPLDIDLASSYSYYATILEDYLHAPYVAL